jgi:tetratricopeptide (TPR) repeat protein
VVEDLEGQAFSLQLLEIKSIPVYTWLMLEDVEFKGVTVLARRCSVLDNKAVQPYSLRCYSSSSEELDEIEFAARKCFRMERYTEALKKYSYGLEMAASHLEFLVGCASCYFAVADYARALKYSLQALEVNANEPRSKALKTSCLVYLDRWTELRAELLQSS